MFSGGNPRCPTRRCTEWRPGCLLQQIGRSRRATIGELSVRCSHVSQIQKGFVGRRYRRPGRGGACFRSVSLGVNVAGRH